MVATFHLHCLGHRIKYGNPEERWNATQQFLSITRPCCSIEFIESFLFWVILISYNKSIYIYIYIFVKLGIFILSLLSSAVMVFLHCMLNILSYEKIFCEFDESIASEHDPSSMWYFWMFIVNPLSILWIFFFSRKLCFFWSPCLLLINEWISLDTSNKPTLGFSWKLLLSLE